MPRQLPSISAVPVILGLVGLLAGIALVSDHNVRTWAVVMSCTTLAAVAYGAYQEHRAQRAVTIARRRLGSAPHDDVQREMDRARRHERPLAIARLHLGRDPRMPRSSSGRRLGSLDSVDVRRLLRSTDRIWRQGRSLYLLLPETTAAAARHLIARAAEALPGITHDARVVAFPEDGVTMGALFEALGGTPPAPGEVTAEGDVAVPALADAMPANLARVTVPSETGEAERGRAQ